MNTQSSCARGAIVAEFAIIVPLLLLVAIAGLEFSRSFKYTEVATMLAREGASIAYRMCSAERDVIAANQCLQTVRETVDDFGNNVFPGANVLLSMYRYPAENEDCTGEIQQVAIVGVGAHQTKVRFIGDERSQQDEQDRSQGEIDRQAVCRSGVLIVSEVFIPYEPLVPLFPYNPEVFYEIAIL
ncbi:MAG: pilus assembly protein [Bdellovibrionales bacterium]|nr:pilus assembly protein [Bdellovibrionales bacterium]